MTLVSIEPRPYADPRCRGPQAPAERVALAMSLCGKRGVQLTRLRRQVLELLWETGRPTGAYELIEALKLRVSRPVGPPTVYRVLAFLISQGLVSKIESQNAYVPCAHPERPHGGVFFICNQCGTTVEIENPQLEALMDQDAKSLGFRIARRVVELQGTCAACGVASAGAAPQGA